MPTGDEMAMCGSVRTGWTIRANSMGKMGVAMFDHQESTPPTYWRAAATGCSRSIRSAATRSAEAGERWKVPRVGGFRWRSDSSRCQSSRVAELYDGTRANVRASAYWVMSQYRQFLNKRKDRVATVPSVPFGEQGIVRRCVPATSGNGLRGWRSASAKWTTWHFHGSRVVRFLPEGLPTVA
jgi:hypothetical protein